MRRTVAPIRRRPIEVDQAASRVMASTRDIMSSYEQVAQQVIREERQVRTVRRSVRLVAIVVLAAAGLLSAIAAAVVAFL